MAVATNGKRITREDLQQAYTRLLGEGESTAQSAAPQMAVVVAAVALGVVALAYLAGKRRGRRAATLIVRRV